MKLMTHIVAGYPDLQTSKELALAMAESGVEFIEIQIPFSDPIADGPTILRANQVALDNGVTADDCFELLADLHSQCDTKFLLMTYFNIPFAYGLEKFCRKAAEYGAYGLIIPDIPLDEEPHEKYIETCKRYDLKAIQIVSPLTTDERLEKIDEVADGFVYCVGNFGTTGEQAGFYSDLANYLKKVRSKIELPLALGFGISSKEQVEKASDVADIVVMGSKIVNTFDEGGVDAVRNLLLTFKMN